jgi:hypothetical protein
MPAGQAAPVAIGLYREGINLEGRLDNISLSLEHAKFGIFRENSDFTGLPGDNASYAYLGSLGTLAHQTGEGVDDPASLRPFGPPVSYGVYSWNLFLQSENLSVHSIHRTSLAVAMTSRKSSYTSP